MAHPHDASGGGHVVAEQTVNRLVARCGGHVGYCTSSSGVICFLCCFLVYTWERTRHSMGGVESGYFVCYAKGLIFQPASLPQLSFTSQEALTDIVRSSVACTNSLARNESLPYCVPTGCKQFVRPRTRDSETQSILRHDARNGSPVKLVHRDQRKHSVVTHRAHATYNLQ